MKIIISADSLIEAGVCSYFLEKFREKYGEVLELNWTREVQLDYMRDIDGPNDWRRSQVANAYDYNLIPLWSLSKMDLSGEDLQYVDFTNINLFETDLRGANLHGAIFRRADLDGTCFNRADLSGAVFTINTIEHAITRGAYYDSTTKFPEGFDPVDAGMVKLKKEEHDDSR